MLLDKCYTNMKGVFPSGVQTCFIYNKHPLPTNGMGGSLINYSDSTKIDGRLTWS